MKYKGRMIIKVQGGLGNQMFQYALYRKLEIMGYNVSLDLRLYNIQIMHNGFELIKNFKVNPRSTNSKDLIAVLGTSRKKIFNIRRKIFGEPRTYICENNVGFKYNPQIYNIKKAYLDGYWQTEKYFSDIRSLLLGEFKVDLSDDNRNQKLLKKIEKCNSVSIHIRRGDYISNAEANKLHGNITTITYYTNAIKEIYSKVEKPYFFIFSDDKEWVKENFKLNDMMIVEHNKGKESYKDMILMSKCKHNIIANSSFSWWGAWLNTNPKKIVLAPDKWFNNMEAPDVLPSEWIKVPIK